jgi:hydroxyacylglutathione hydrolase
MIEVRMFPCLKDNYGFLVRDPASGETVSIDTPDADEILRQAQAAGWSITQIWNTHHHFDHAGGNLALKAATGARISAPAGEARKIPGVDLTVREGDTVTLGTSKARVIETGGHTLGHVAYHFPDAETAFVGDTLFALGCGRLFEGDASQMWESLSKLRALPPQTRLYCAHEYTQSNARFALSVDAGNPALRAYAAEVDDKRARGEPTVPTTVAKERAANPFLRADAPDFQRAIGMTGAPPADVFAEARRRKDVF